MNGVPIEEAPLTDPTESPSHHLAQLNVGRLHKPLDAPETAEFVAALDPINALAEAAPGFVWRLTDDDGASSSYVRAADDPLFIINLSVWETPRHLHDYVYRTEHIEFLRRRGEWFATAERPYACCWWVPVGHRPDEVEAMAMLARFERDGPTDEVFAFRPPFPAPPSPA